MYIIDQLENKKKPRFKDEVVNDDKEKYYLNDFFRKELLRKEE